jgi:hypothetical protein
VGEIILKLKGLYMKNKRCCKYLFIGLLLGITLIIILVGCSVEHPIEITSLPTIISTEMPTITVTKTPRPTHTNIPSATAKYTITPNVEYFQVEEIHVPIQDSIPDNILLSGELLISDTENQEKRNIYLLDLSNQSKYLVDERHTNKEHFSISPNMKWIAYYCSSDGERFDKLIIRNISTNQTIAYPFEIKNGGHDVMHRWLNNNELLVLQNEYTQMPPDFFAFNPFTNTTRKLSQLFPEYWADSNPPYIYSWPQFNSSGQYILYPSQNIGEPRLFLILYHSTTNQIIKKFEHQSVFDVGPPVWNQQGNQFFYVFKNLHEANVTFAIGDLNGNYNELAILRREISSYNIREKIWSPDGRYIAVFMDDYETLEYNTHKISIFDLLEQKIIIPDFRVNILWDQEIVWSPDSTKLIIEDYPEDYSIQNENQVILFDLETMQAGVLMEDTKVYGWVPVE